MKIGRTFIERGLLVCVVVFCCVSFFPHIFPENWIIDLFSNFKLQLAISGAALLFLCLKWVSKKWLAGITCVAGMVWNLSFVLPYYLANTDHIASETEISIRLASINLLSENAEVQQVSDFLEDSNPDVVVFLEYTRKWDGQLSRLKENYPYKKLIPLPGHFGIAVWSRLEMDAVQANYGSEKVPSIEAEINTAAGPLTLIATHPLPPLNQYQFHSRNNQLIKIAERLPDVNERVLVVGDFNLSSFSKHFTVLEEAGLRDTRKGFGLLPTWPANFYLLSTTIDHALISDKLKVLNRSVGPNIGSDHLPILMELGLD